MHNTDKEYTLHIYYYILLGRGQNILLLVILATDTN